jgi:8-oxo-dGTP diphosphatase
MIEKRKVYAYIVQDRDLMVFEHPDSPEAGIQVPGGTVEDGEALEAAVLREAFEETGLEGLTIAAYLGQQVRDMRDYGKDEMHQRHFYHLTCSTVIPQQWRSVEQFPSGEASGPIHFLLYRAPLDNLPGLIADLDAYIRVLRGKLMT